ncbi:hypothetical protein Hanom_Chr16g01439581 [Helianthus anomalus]
MGLSGHLAFALTTVAKLEISDRMVENVHTKKFLLNGGSKTYIPQKNYTKTTYSPLLSEKFGGSTAPSRPHYATPMSGHTVVCSIHTFLDVGNALRNSQ